MTDYYIIKKGTNTRVENRDETYLIVDQQNVARELDYFEGVLRAPLEKIGVDEYHARYDSIGKVEQAWKAKMEKTIERLESDIEQAEAAHGHGPTDECSCERRWTALIDMARELQDRGLLKSFYDLHFERKKGE